MHLAVEIGEVLRGDIIDVAVDADIAGRHLGAEGGGRVEIERLGLVMHRVGQVGAGVIGLGDLAGQRPFLLQVIERLLGHAQDDAEVLLFRPDAVALEGHVARRLVGVVGGVHHAAGDEQAVVARLGRPDDARQRAVDVLLPGLILVFAD